jgi:hypothetical protein
MRTVAFRSWHAQGICLLAVLSAALGLTVLVTAVHIFCGDHWRSARVTAEFQSLPPVTEPPGRTPDTAPRVANTHLIDRLG